ncbi:MAG: transposase [Deltaproteobacteria bacterium]|nr:transposase [Deltaproteobacteria bacterium]
MEFNSDNDQVHLLVLYPPKVTGSGVVKSLKGVSRWA